jgi:hypothetical protein
MRRAGVTLGYYVRLEVSGVRRRGRTDPRPILMRGSGAFYLLHTLSARLFNQGELVSEPLQGDPPPSLGLAGAAFDVVALAASAGGLTAISKVMAGLPANFPASIVVVQHLDPRHRSLMADILSRRTSLRVKQAEEGDRLTTATVYIAPPAGTYWPTPMARSPSPSQSWCISSALRPISCLNRWQPASKIASSPWC